LKRKSHYIMSEKITVIVHRGSHQIGGCCTEISYKGTRIAIDFGSPLPGEYDEKLSVPGLTEGESSFDAVFFTHYHGDHIGEIANINPDIPIYMSGMAKDIVIAYKEYSDRFYPNVDIERITEIKPGKEYEVGSLKVLPILSDHSAADSLMYLICADGFHILHTGDFRLHGRFKDELLAQLENIGDIDLLITEGTTLSRKADGKEDYTEEVVERKIGECINEYKYCFFILSSTNFDRLQEITNCVEEYCSDNKGKYFLIDEFEKSLFEMAERRLPDRYHFKRKTTYAHNLDDKMRRIGFAMMFRMGNRDHERLLREYMESYKDDTCLIYSMWSGYMEQGELKDITEYAREKNRFRIIHSSGHVTKEDLEEFIRILKPRKTIVIHTEEPDLLTIDSVIKIEDGVSIDFS
jgi:ribonuclease J